MKIKIEKLIFGGAGIGHLEDGKPFDNTHGKPVFVKKTVPGDEVDIKITKDKKSYSEALISKIISPSAERIDSPCKYFDHCGGCDHQNISYPNQLKFKQEISEEVLKRAGIQIKTEPIIAGSDFPQYYRNSIRFFFIHKDNDISFGRKDYRDFNKLIEVDNCLLQSETANQMLSDLKIFINKKIKDKKTFWQLKIRQGKFTDEFMIEIITSFEELPEKEGIVKLLKNINGVKSIYHTVAPGKSLKNLKRHLIYGSPMIFEKIGPYKFQISPESFFQTNSLGIKNLYDQIKEYADIKMGDNVLDLYCGTGSIGIYLSTLAKEVVGVESVPEAIRDACDNAKLNKIQNIKFACSDVLKYLSFPVCKFNIIIVDPPRAGLNKNVIQKLSKLDFKRLIYVSCNPSTFARDIKLFENYGLKLTKVQPIDMFPQTHHLECVGVIHR